MGYRGILLLACFVVGSASAATINVPADQPTIQAAINAANNGDIVLVAPGTYYEQINFEGKAITVKSSGGAAVTILDGNNSGPIVLFDTGETSNSVLQGFTFTHAVDDGTSGAAIVVASSSPIIEDNIFADNTDASGGGIGSSIFGNYSSALIIRNYFVDNIGGDGDFPSVISFNGGSPVVADNVFANNAAAACVDDELNGSPQIFNNTFVGNVTGFQAFISSGDSGDMTVSNNLIAFNQTGIYMGGTWNSQPQISNNLVYGNTSAEYLFIDDQTGINGNISVAPRLKDWVDGDVHLLYGSPAIDTGDSSIVQISGTDFYGDMRVAVGKPNGAAVVDIGAAEYMPPTVTASVGSLAVTANTAKTGALAASGADPAEPLTFAIATQPMHGALTLINASTGAIKYVPAQDYSGLDSFTFDVTDPYGTVSAPATEQVTITDPMPSVTGGSVNTSPDTAVSDTLSATQAYPTQQLSYVLASNPAHGSVSLTASTGQFKYTPATGFAGTDSFTFQAKDALGTLSGVTTETVTVNDIAPKATNGSAAGGLGRMISGFLKATAAYAGQVLAYSAATHPSHGVLTINSATGAYTYKPSPGYVSTDVFTFKVTDQWGAVSNTARVSVSIY